MKYIATILGLFLLVTSSLFAQSLPKVLSPEEIQFRKNLQYFLIKDGIEISVKEGRAGPVIYAPDGKSYAYRTSEKGVVTLIKDGKEIGKYDDIQEMKYSPDGKSFAYMAQENDKYFLFKDGKKTVIPSMMGTHSYSIDNKHGQILKDNGKYLLVEDGVVSDQEFGSYQAISNSPNAKKYNFHQPQVGDIQKLSEYSRNKILYSPDGKSSASIASAEDGKVSLIKDGTQIGTYDDIILRQYSSDGKRFAFIARRGQSSLLYTKYVAVIDGIESQEYSHIGEIIFSPDGVGYSYFADKPGNLESAKSAIDAMLPSKNGPNIYMVLGLVIGIVLLIYFSVKKYLITKNSSH